MLDPFCSDHPGGYLADSQFDYPGHAGGWRYQALDPENRFADLTPPAELSGSATPQAFLVCADDPHARIGRDVVHVGHRRRPCLQWHAPAAGAYRLEGEIALLMSEAAGQLEVRVIVDDVEVFTSCLDYPEMLTFVVEAAVRPGGFVRVLFSCRGHIDNNDALQYLRIRAADAPLAAGQCRVTSRCEESPAWQGLRTAMAVPGGPAAPDAAALAHRLYRVAAPAEPGLLALIQAQVLRDGAAQASGHRQPRFFRVHPMPAGGGAAA